MDSFDKGYVLDDQDINFPIRELGLVSDLFYDDRAAFFDFGLRAAFDVQIYVRNEFDRLYLILNQEAEECSST